MTSMRAYKDHFQSETWVSRERLEPNYCQRDAYFLQQLAAKENIQLDISPTTYLFSLLLFLSHTQIYTFLLAHSLLFFLPDAKLFTLNTSCN